VKGFVLVTSSASATEPLHVVLELGFHNAADRHNVTTDARVDQVVFNLAVDRLGHLACVDVLDVILDLLQANTLEERSLCSVLLGIEDAGAAIDRNAAVWRLPLSVNKIDVDVHFAVVALKLDAFDQNFNRRDSKHCASNAHEFVDQM
jgi:hypothetical protein